MKQTLFQYFEWYYPSDGTLYTQLKKHAPQLATLGITKVWMPPAYKGQAGNQDVGYGVYDLYDLGEFDQKGSIATKYGTKDQYLEAIQACHDVGMDVVADIVLNHRMGADEMETVQAHPVDWNNRNADIEDQRTIQVWTKYTFLGRQKKYSDFTWDWTCFDGTDYAQNEDQNRLYRFEGKQWDQAVSQEEGNFDFIMGNDLDFSNPTVIEELYRWGRWYTDFTHVDAYRLDAIKSIDAHFFKGWLNHVNPEAFAVGEYWSANIDELCAYIEASEHAMTLFDVPLHFHLHQASRSQGQYDMRTIFDDTLTQRYPDYASAFVDNHDTQPGQALESWVDGWFKVHAYALILLTQTKYPCVFYGDMYGIPNNSIDPVPLLSEIIWLRSHTQEDATMDWRMDDAHCIGWMICQEEPIIVVMTNEKGQSKWFDCPVPMVRLSDGFQVEAGQNVEFSCMDGSCEIYVSAKLKDELDKELV